MKRKILVGIGILIIILIGSFILLTGRARTDVVLGGYDLSADGKTMTLKVGVSSSAGYIRKMKKTSGSMNYYLTFYSTFGINSKLGAKDNFDIEIDENVDEIYFYTGNKGYKLVLIKDSVTQEWKKINYSSNDTFKLNLLDREDILKLGIDTYALNDNYFEFNDKNIIDKIYNIFDGLETKKVSKIYNPENPDELYKVKFICDPMKLLYSDKVREDTIIEVYRKEDKYYAEQRYNGIYEITEKDFNTIKSYIK